MHKRYLRLQKMNPAVGLCLRTNHVLLVGPCHVKMNMVLMVRLCLRETKMGPCHHKGLLVGPCLGETEIGPCHHKGHGWGWAHNCVCGLVHTNYDVSYPCLLS
jgi:hypothetical protein